jgi:hypothetical protein
MAESAADRINRSMNRLDAITGHLAERSARELREWKRADSAAEDWRRDQMRKHADRCNQHQVRYDSMFEPFGKRAPQPEADAYPPTYRRDLFRVGQSMLPSDHDLTGFDPEDLDGAVIIPMEEKLFEALRQQAAEPTGDNLPENPDDPRARREVRDDSGRVTVVYKAKNSFIKYMPSHAQRVLRLMNPKTGQVLFGPPFPMMPGR